MSHFSLPATHEHQQPYPLHQHDLLIHFTDQLLMASLPGGEVPPHSREGSSEEREDAVLLQAAAGTAIAPHVDGQGIGAHPEDRPLEGNAPASTHRAPKEADSFYLCFLALAGVSACIFLGWVASMLMKGAIYGGEIRSRGNVLSSPSDDRGFSYIVLANGLEALLISDPDADRSGAALDVRVGSWHDPQEFPGLAHAVEHFLFLGTQKYPGENDYGMFLNAHGGSSNAYVSGWARGCVKGVLCNVFLSFPLARPLLPFHPLTSLCLTPHPTFCPHPAD